MVADEMNLKTLSFSLYIIGILTFFDIYTIFTEGLFHKILVYPFYFPIGIVLITLVNVAGILCLILFYRKTILDKEDEINNNKCPKCGADYSITLQRKIEFEKLKKEK